MFIQGAERPRQPSFSARVEESVPTVNNSARGSYRSESLGGICNWSCCQWIKTKRAGVLHRRRAWEPNPSTTASSNRRATTETAVMSRETTLVPRGDGIGHLVSCSGTDVGSGIDRPYELQPQILMRPSGLKSMVLSLERDV